MRPWKAESRGVALELGADNVGPISPYTVKGLRNRGISLPHPLRDPLPLALGDLSAADLVVVLDENEHRPFMNIKFSEWADKVTYWHIGDLHITSEMNALPEIEEEVRKLVQRLSSDLSR